MKTRILISAVLLGLSGLAAATPESDREAYVAHFEKRFPSVALDDYKNGVYALLPEARAQWESIEEFPPYEIDVDEGQVLYDTAFANGKSLADCFGDGAVRSQYPKWDSESAQVVTMEQAINNCRQAHGEKPYGYKKGKIAQISAYMSMQSRGQAMDVKIPDAAAMAAYEDGKEFYYSKRGQLNLSCADCHLVGAGNRVRADTLSPGLGQPTGWPVYRTKWQSLGTLHRRFGGCNKNIRAKPFKAQGTEYSNLEYFLSYMSNGLAFNGPSSRK